MNGFLAAQCFISLLVMHLWTGKLSGSVDQWKDLSASNVMLRDLSRKTERQFLFPLSSHAYVVWNIRFTGMGYRRHPYVANGTMCV